MNRFQIAAREFKHKLSTVIKAYLTIYNGRID